MGENDDESPDYGLAYLLTGLILPWSPRPARAAQLPSSPQESHFTIVPLEDGQLAIVLDRDVALNSQAAPGLARNVSFPVQRARSWRRAPPRGRPATTVYSTRSRTR